MIDEQWEIGTLPTKKPMFMPIVAIITAGVVATPMLAIDIARAQVAGKYLEGKAFERQLAASLGGSWSDVPLKKLVAGLSRSQNVAIVLDRRIDHSRPVTLAVSNRPLGEVLGELARNQKLDVFLLGPIIYFAPQGEAVRLQAAAELRRDDVGRLPKTVAHEWRKKVSLAWDDLAVPGEIVKRLAEEGRFTIDNPDRLPHDLWAAASLPRLALADRLSFILGQFGLTFEFSDAEASKKGTAIRLIPMTDEASAGKDAMADTGRAGLEAHIKKRKPQTGVTGEIRIEKFSVNEASLEPLLEQLAARLGLELVIDREAIIAAGTSTDKRVTLSAARVTPAELFEKILAPLGLAARRDGKRVIVGPSKILRPH